MTRAQQWTAAYDRAVRVGIKRVGRGVRGARELAHKRMGAARMANRTASVYAQRQALLRRGLPLMRLVLKARAVGMAQVRAQRVAKRWAGTERGERAEYRAGNLWDADVRRTDYLDMLGGLGLL